MEQTVQKSELQQLIDKNARDGLTTEERTRALEFIANPVMSENKCWICDLNRKQSESIFDTDLCQRHAIYYLNLAR